MQQLYPKAVWLFFFQPISNPLLGFWMIWFLVIISFVISSAVGGDRVLTVLLFSLPLLPIAIVILLILDYIWAKLAYQFYRYQLTDDAVKIEKGVIWKKYISIPYERIQNVDIRRGILARLLGLSDLHIQTAGYSGGYWQWMVDPEGRLLGLDIQTAEQLREELIKKVKGTKQGL